MTLRYHASSETGNCCLLQVEFATCTTGVGLLGIPKSGRWYIAVIRVLWSEARICGRFRTSTPPTPGLYALRCISVGNQNTYKLISSQEALHITRCTVQIPSSKAAVPLRDILSGRSRTAPTDDERCCGAAYGGGK